MSLDEIKIYQKRPRTQTQINAVLRRCINELYMNSSPPITFKELEKLYANKNIPYWTRHTIPEYLYDNIVKKYEKVLPKNGQTQLSMILLNYAPTTK